MKASANPWKNSKELISSEIFLLTVSLWWNCTLKKLWWVAQKLKHYFYLNSNTNGPVSLVGFFSLEIQTKKKKEKVKWVNATI